MLCSLRVRPKARHSSHCCSKLDLAFLSIVDEKPCIFRSKLNPGLLPQLKVGLASFAFSLQDNDIGAVRILPVSLSQLARLNILPPLQPWPYAKPRLSSAYICRKVVDHNKPHSGMLKDLAKFIRGRPILLSLVSFKLVRNEDHGSSVRNEDHGSSVTAFEQRVFRHRT